MRSTPLPSSRLTSLTFSTLVLCACNGLMRNDAVDDQFVGYSGSPPAPGGQAGGGQAGAGQAGGGASGFAGAGFGGAVAAGAAGDAGAGAGGAGQGGGGGTGFCGDALCSVPDESCSTCEADCGSCGTCSHGVCEQGPPLAIGCGDCSDKVCSIDAFCCQSFWDPLCVQQAESLCGLNCGGAGGAGGVAGQG
ncbi:MAG: hypothetical protein RMJ98_18915, partial [Myxococcales bacterium]|nr:hypothetical protein [Myxococcales bacterium]